MKQNDLISPFSTEDLPDGWILSSIPELIDEDGVFSDGDWIESKDQDPSGNVRLIQLADIGDGYYRNRSSRYLTNETAIELNCTFLSPGDVLIARMPDPLGRACIFPGDTKQSITAVDVCIIRSSKFDHRWLMHIINSPQMRQAIESLQSGTTRKRISRKNLARIQFPTPPKHEQESIADKIEEFFTQLDVGVAELQEAKARLERYRQSVLKAAVTGELTREWREAHQDELEPAEQLLERILKERRAKWEEEEWAKLVERAKKKVAQKKKKEAGLPYYIRDLEPEDWEHIEEEDYQQYLPKDDKWKEKYSKVSFNETENDIPIPNSWLVTSIESISSNIQYGYTQSANYNNIGPKFIRITDIQDGSVDWDSVPFCEIDESDYRKYKLKRNDVLFARTGATTGKHFLIGDPHGAVFASYLIRLQINNEVNSKYISLFFLSPYYWSQIMQVRKGSAQPGVNATILSNLLVPLPPVEEQYMIVQKVERKLSIADENEEEIDRALQYCKRLRQSILKNAFEGKLV